MEHSGMRGYKDNTIRGILKGYRGFQPHVKRSGTWGYTRNDTVREF
ncbi:hypothetical protein Barb6_02581 [Bacteroidales bacterium Barb6]|nr:hypothetical protein Barb6_02581 [Bacteroidales bacterium Barb6]